MKKSLVLGVVLSLSSICFAGQKSYDVIFSAPAKVSGVKLPAGEYKVKVDGANAIFTDSKSKTVSVFVKVETGSKKFAYTSVAGGLRITSVTDARNHATTFAYNTTTGRLSSRTNRGSAVANFTYDTTNRVSTA